MCSADYPGIPPYKNPGDMGMGELRMDRITLMSANMRHLSEKVWCVHAAIVKNDYYKCSKRQLGTSIMVCNVPS